MLFSLAGIAVDSQLPFVSPVLGDHMVLQRNKVNTFWGWTQPGEKVTVKLSGKSASGIAGPDGKWVAKLMPPKTGGPYTVSIEGKTNQRELKDVLVGDVWLCGGQSNMEMGLASTANGSEAVAGADHPQMRLYLAPRQIAYSPAASLAGAWKVCTPKSVSEGGWNGFSGVGYYFGRKLQQDTKVPIGLLQVAWGGTSAEAWTGRDALIPLKDFAPGLSLVESAQANGEPPLGTYLDFWLMGNDAGTREKWSAPDHDDSAWKTIELPKGEANFGSGRQRGVVWLRKSFALSKLPTGDAELILGNINETDTPYLNGVVLGATSFSWAFRRYRVPASLLKNGQNTLAVRVFNPREDGGFLSEPENLKLEIPGGESVSLAGAWKLKVGFDRKAADGSPLSENANPDVPGTLHAGMISPLSHLSIKGAIWYQGETNSWRGWQYRSLLPALIQNWRDTFGQGDFPFYIVSLASFGQNGKEPGDDAWAELREAQSHTASTVKNSGLVVTTDVGDANDVHPTDKRSVGERLALIALAKDYGRKIEYSGPQYRSHKIEGSKMRITFNHSVGGLIIKGDLNGFQIAGEDKKWHWAKATLESSEVIVWSEEVPSPVAVRYAWQTNPPAPLYNKSNLPAIPFRTDSWPLSSVGRK